jgi:hypothetical protein
MRHAIASTSAPEVLEPIRRQLGVANRVLDVLVAEVSLHSPCIVAFVRQAVVYSRLNKKYIL